MLNLNYRNWLNLVLFQSLWFAAVLGRESLLWLLVLLLTAHVLFCSDRKTELKVMLLCAGLGSAVDIVLTLAGIFVFSPPPTVLPIPIWLIALWLGFAATLRHSLSYLLKRPAIAIPAAGLTAPLSYFAAMRLGAVDFGFDTPFTLILLGVLWAAMMAVFILICRARHQRRPRQGQPPFTRRTAVAKPALYPRG
ncbi:MAG: DUF2878 domain-containing protein [Alphaproteobacteria bacterium]|nr:DUF2878 domain-containing protein [Alphaproteobacteria bacterium]